MFFLFCNTTQRIENGYDMTLSEFRSIKFSFSKSYISYILVFWSYSDNATKYTETYLSQNLYKTEHRPM